MRYKNVLYTAVISALCLGITFCSDFLDEMPDNRTELTTEESITKVLISAYSMTTNCHIGEFYSDNTGESSRAYSHLSRLDEHLYRWQQTTEENQDSPHALWNDCYNSTVSANQALAATKQVGNPQSSSAQRGEALICHAYNHFVLATTFYKAYGANADKDLGIPYTRKPETSVNPQYSRGTVAEVYRNIAADLGEGSPLIDDSIYSRVKYHFSKEAAYVFTARFYPHYTQPDFSNCQKVINYANMILDTNIPQCLRDWTTLGALSPNKDMQSNTYIDVDNRANLLIISAASYWPLVSDPDYANCGRCCVNNTTASESRKSEGP